MRALTIGGLLSLLTACAQKSVPSDSEISPRVEKMQAVAPGEERGRRVPRDVVQAEYAIVKLRLDEAARLLDGEVGRAATAARARLDIYRADCESADARLAVESVRSSEEARDLAELARRCVGATAGAVIVEDEERGVWLRLQDRADQVLAPLIIEVAVRAREALSRDLGETLPHPLRIDLVRDLFSLSAVSGLPLEAAETTGTVAVARWGRITMVSPRAMARGFPWADTLAHEITHLLISRATAERAPLWLQEGVAKREERRWRDARLFDDALEFSRRAYDAARNGESVGVDRLGPSIAMLPSAKAASIAFAEVTSFMEFWIEKNGPKSLSLLLRDLEVAPDDESAMRSVSGFSVGEWQTIWRDALNRRFVEEAASEPEDQEERLGPRALSRTLRLVELLTVDGRPAEAELEGAVDLERAPHVAALRYLTARAAFAVGSDQAALLLGRPEDVEDAHAGHLALSAWHRLREEGSSEVAQSWLGQARDLDPLLPEAACGGVPWVGSRGTSPPPAVEFDPMAEDPLCKEARRLEMRGSR